MKKHIKSLSIMITAIFLFGSISLWASANKAETVEEWNDFYNTMSTVTGGVKTFSNTSCKTGLNPDDLSFDLEFEKLTDLVDCWVTMGFNKNDTEMNIMETTSSGIKFMMRNAEGKLNIQAFKVLGEENIFHSTFNANAIGTTNIHLYKEGTVYKIAVGTEVQTLTGVTAADFTKADGKTFLAFTAFDASGDAPNTRVWSVKNLKNSVYKTTDESPTESNDKSTTSDIKATTTKAEPIVPKFDVSKAAGWSDFYNTITEVDGGVEMFGNVVCKLPLGPDDISFDLDFKKFNGDIDCWITMGLMKTDGELNVSENTSTGIKFLMRNSGGKLNIQVFKKIGETDILNETFKANATGTTRIRFYKDGSAYKLAVGSQVKTLTGVVTADFTNTEDKTYLAFSAYDVNGDAPNNRVWSIKNMSNSEISNTSNINPNSPETGDSCTLYITVLCLISTITLLIVAGKRRINN